MEREVPIPIRFWAVSRVAAADRYLFIAPVARGARGSGYRDGTEQGEGTHTPRGGVSPKGWAARHFFLSAEIVQLP